MSEAKEKIEIAEWFDVYSREHLEGYWHLEKYGRWPEGFIPENVRLPPGWHVQLMAKMGDAWLRHMAGETK